MTSAPGEVGVAPWSTRLPAHAACDGVVKVANLAKMANMAKVVKMAPAVNGSATGGSRSFR